MTKENITVRDATSADASILAKLLLEAGDGLYEFLFSDLDRGKTARDVLTEIIAEGRTPLGWQNFRVAVRPNVDIGCEVVVGMIHAFPSDQMPDLIPDRVPADRIAHLAPLLHHRVDGHSLMVNAMAVKPTQRGAGIGTQLIAETVGMAGAQRKKRLISRVAAGNDRAMKLFANFGFRNIDSVDLPAHNRLTGRRTVFLERDV